MSNSKALPEKQELIKLLRYDPETGKFYRLATGEETGSLRQSGYITLYLEGQTYRAHRVAYKIQTGLDPVLVDHINGDKADNRWANLRSCSSKQNQGNRKNQPSKYGRGVRKRGERFYAQHVKGFFATAKEASAAYKQWHIETFGHFSIYSCEQPLSWPSPAHPAAD
jgi:hypothetical protein